jgi:hypothetical protein
VRKAQVVVVVCHHLRNGTVWHITLASQARLRRAGVPAARG